MEKKVVCANCGAINNENAKFCYKCGAKMDKIEVPVQKTETKEKKEKKSKKPLIIGIISILLVAGLVFGITRIVKINNPVNKVISKLKDGDFESAKDVYSSDIEGNQEKKADLIDELKEYLEDSKKDFFEEKITYEQINDNIEMIEYFGKDDMSNQISAVKSFVEIINDSRTAYKTAEEYMANKNYVKAIENYNKVSVEDSYYESAKTKKQEATNTYKTEEMAKAEELANAGDYEGAVAILNEVSVHLTNDSDVITKLDIYTTAMEDGLVAEALTKAEELAGKSDYEGAIAILEEAAKKVSNNKTLIAKVDEYTKTMEKNTIDSAIKTANEHRKIKKYAEALNALKTVEKYNNESVNTLYSAIYDEFLNKVLADAESVFKTSGHRAAISKMDEYSSYFSTDKKYIEKRDYYVGLTPVNLTEMDTFSENGWPNPKGFAKDHLGNEFSNCFVVTVIDCGSDYAEYYVNGKYNSISGTIAASENEYTYEIGRVEIYADDELVYTSKNVTAKTDPFNFKVDISGKKYIKVKVWAIKNSYDGNWSNATIILANVTLNKY